MFTQRGSWRSSDRPILERTEEGHCYGMTEPTIHKSLQPVEAYSMAPGRDPQKPVKHPGVVRRSSGKSKLRNGAQPANRDLLPLRP